MLLPTIHRQHHEQRVLGSTFKEQKNFVVDREEEEIHSDINSTFV